jgi:serine/threonine protein kinase
MQSYTAFLHGSDFNIISPLADLDLHTYFEGSYPDFHPRSRLFSPAHLLYGAACLAGALRFLHEGLQPMSIAEKIYCAHLDLKPENILVIWPRGSNPPAGRWLVHDFGTSKIKESRNAHSSKTLVAPGDFIRQFSLTQASRTPGPFQAPEVQNSTERVVGTESDIWSLGCILAQVLTFALGGPAFVSQLAQSTYEGFSDDYFYNAADKNFALKGPVVQYLDSLTSSYRDNTWIMETLGLISRILVKDPRLRPSAKEVQDTLERVYRRQDASLLAHCSWANKDLPLPPPVSEPRVEQPQPQPRPQRPLESNQRRERPIPEPNQRPDRPVPDTNQRSQRPVPEHPRPRQSLPQVIVRSPTTVNGGFEDQPGLEVVASPTSSPRSDSLSQFELESIRESRIPHHSLSRSSSTSTRPVSLTEDVTFIRLFVPKYTVKSIICPGSCHVAFISKKQTSIMRILDNDWTKNQKGPIINAGYLQACTKDNPDSFEWVDGCMSGPYIVLRAKRTNGRECKVRKPLVLSFVPLPR